MTAHAGHVQELIIPPACMMVLFLHFCMHYRALGGPTGVALPSTADEL